MEKKMLQIKGSQMARSLVVLAVLLLSWVGGKAWAEGSGTQADPYVLTDGGTLSMPSAGFVYAKFVVPADVTSDDVSLVLDGLKSMLLQVYADDSYSNDIAQDSWFSGSNPYTLTIPIAKGTAAGTTYYFKEFSMTSATVSVKYGAGAANDKAPVELESVTPQNASQLSASYSLISFAFTREVKFKGARMTIGDDVTSLIANGQGRYVSIEPKEILLEKYHQGILKEGDAITITLLGVEALDGTNVLGDVSVVYVAAPSPVMLASSVNTPGNGLDTFLSWMPEDYSNGLVQLVFDGDLDTSKPLFARLSFGSVETEGDYYTEELPVQFLASNILAVDIRGKLRTPQTMNIASGTNYGVMDLTFSGIKDAHGNYVFSNTPGALGSFGFSYTYRLSAYDLVREFTPASGSSIDGVKSIELWVNENGDGQFSYSSAQFAYTYEGKPRVAILSASDIRAEVDPEESSARIFTIAVPEFSRDADTEVVFSFIGLSTPDGADHSAELTATYKTAGYSAPVSGVLSALMTSADGSQVIDLLAADGVEKMLGDGTLDIATAMDSEIGVMQYQIVNVTTGEIIKSMADKNEKTDDGHWSFWIPIDYKLFVDNIYQIQLKGWSDDNAKNYGSDPIFVSDITIKGATQPYKYSNVELVEPAELLFDRGEANFTLTSAEDNQISFTFSGAVEIAEAFVALGMGATEPVQVEMSMDEKTATLTIPSYVLSSYSQFIVSLLAKDKAGMVVKGNNGEEDASYISVYVDAKFNLPEVTLLDPANNSEVEKISTLKFGYDKGIAPSYTGEPITIMNMMREVVATSTDVQVIYQNDTDEYGYEVVVSFDKEVTDNGFYVVRLPEGFFNLDLQAQGFSMKSNTEQYFNLSVANGQVTDDLGEVEITPSAGQVTEIPSLLILTFKDQTEVGAQGNCTLTDEKGNSYRAELVASWECEWNQLQVELADGAITADGIYTLTILENAVTYGLYGLKTNSQPISFVYTIGKATGVSNIFAAEGNKVNVYTINGTQLFNQADASALRALSPGLYIINGKKVIIRR